MSALLSPAASAAEITFLSPSGTFARPSEKTARLSRTGIRAPETLGDAPHVFERAAQRC
jgi:hypothetical protein